MTKSEFINILIDKQSYLSVRLVEEAVKDVFDVMSHTLQQGERIEIRGFGSFSLRYRKARNARNPKTGELITTKGKHVVYFKPGKELRERVNNSME